MHFPVKLTYGIAANAQLQILDIQHAKKGMQAKIKYLGHTYTFDTTLVGEFNMQNILAAAWACLSLWHRMDELVSIIPDLTWPEWRQECYTYEWVDRYVDYAHTTHGLEVMLSYLEEVKWSWRVIHIFGAPGERDVTKRPEMWHISHEKADIVILTDDDPGKENRRKILRDVARGIPRQEGEDYYIIPNRKDAIAMAVQVAKKWDIVVLTGIGHQDVLVTNFGMIPWNEHDMIVQALANVEK